MTANSTNNTENIINFLTRVGFKVERSKLSGNTFLPGIRIANGTIFVDEENLSYPGDLLHEAGHLAVVSPAERENWSGDFENAGGLELGAIAWSYAACLEIGLQPEIVFHNDGYKGEADWLIETIEGGSQIGVPILQWKGMTNTCNKYKYPKMENWLSQI